MKSKLAGISSKGNYRCKNCDKLVPYHKDGDIINVFITSSTLAQAHELCYKETQLCDHTIEIFELNGLAMDQINVIMIPILKQMAQLNCIRILLAVGANNMLRPLDTFETIQSEFDAFCLALSNINENFSATYEFVDLPYMPCVTQLKGERHGVKIDRVDHITALNKLIGDTNRLSSGRDGAPRLSHCGIDNNNEDIRENRHIPECWREKPLTNAVHLADMVKCEIWHEICQYFKDFPPPHQFAVKTSLYDIKMSKKMSRKSIIIA